MINSLGGNFLSLNLKMSNLSDAKLGDLNARELEKLSKHINDELLGYTLGILIFADTNFRG